MRVKYAECGSQLEMVTQFVHMLKLVGYKEKRSFGFGVSVLSSLRLHNNDGTICVTYRGVTVPSQLILRPLFPPALPPSGLVLSAFALGVPLSLSLFSRFCQADSSPPLGFDSQITVTSRSFLPLVHPSQPTHLLSVFHVFILGSLAEPSLSC